MAPKRRRSKKKEPEEEEETEYVEGASQEEQPTKKSRRDERSQRRSQEDEEPSWKLGSTLRTGDFIWGREVGRMPLAMADVNAERVVEEIRLMCARFCTLWGMCATTR